MTRQRRRNVFKAHRAATATRMVRGPTSNGNNNIPVIPDRATRYAEVRAAVKTQKREDNSRMESLDRQQLVDALRQLDDTEAREIFAESRGTDRTAKQQTAADALKRFVGGHTLRSE